MAGYLLSIMEGRMWKIRQKFFTMTLETDVKGCSAAWQRVCFGYKMSQVQILSSLSLTMSYHISKQEINQKRFKLDIQTQYEQFSILSLYAGKMYCHHIKFFRKRKRSQFSSVERGSPKPDVVGSNPTERDTIHSSEIENETKRMG